MEHNHYLKIDIGNGVFIELVLVEGGDFLMGDAESDFKSEKPVHQVRVSGFYMGKYPVTQAQWQAIMGENPSYFKGADRPVETVSWDDAQDFIRQLNKKINKNFRLPSEAEWEFAARGGTKSEGFIYSGSDNLYQVGWFTENSGDQTQPVGQLMANELGLYDMSGNVWEWCEDDWHENYEHAPEDGAAWIDSNTRGSYRVLRGGGYWLVAVLCRSAYRVRYAPGTRYGDNGFRLVLPLHSGGIAV